MRVVVSALVLVPAGFFRGFAFPMGMVAFGDENKPWFWALNGASSVLASVGSLVLAMAFGFFATVLIGAGLYLLAWVLFRVRVLSAVRAPVVSYVVAPDPIVAARTPPVAQNAE